jgi:transcriptional regulator with XRE-family HTH domain
MSIGMRIRQLREERKMSQGDIEQRTGLLRCYISRVENGHTVPSIETLERFAAALDIPVYRFFYTGEGAALTPHLTPRKSIEEVALEGNESGEEARFLLRLKELFTNIPDSDRAILLTVARRLASANSRSAAR